jgi:hypothetical protein
MAAVPRSGGVASILSARSRFVAAGQGGSDRQEIRRAGRKTEAHQPIELIQSLIEIERHRQFHVFHPDSNPRCHLEWNQDQSDVL